MFCQTGARGSSAETLPGRIYMVETKRKLVASTVDSGIVFFKKITKVCIKASLSIMPPTAYLYYQLTFTINDATIHTNKTMTYRNTNG